MCADPNAQAVFLLIGTTSALTINIAGVVKDWALIGLSMRLFGAQVCRCLSRARSRCGHAAEGGLPVRCWLVAAMHVAANIEMLASVLQVSALNLGGYFLSFVAVCWYNWTKIKAGMEKEKGKAALGGEDAGAARGARDEERAPFLGEEAVAGSAGSSGKGPPHRSKRTHSTE